MAKVKSRWMQEVEPFDDDGFDELIQEIRGFSRELQAENDLAEEREYERARQRISIREV
jgi:hypothetical protein